MSRAGWVRMLLGVAAAGLLALAGAYLLSPPPPAAPPFPAGPSWFEDVTARCGLDFRHQAGGADPYFLPRVIGSGAALLDCDGDDRLDVLLLQNGGPGSKATHRLFRQKADATFEDVSAGSGLDVGGHGMGAAVGDVNNDGRPDVVITEYCGVRLFLNQGECRFVETTEASGLKSVHWGTSAGFVDYDRDGWLDLVVVNYVDYDPSQRCTGGSARQDFCSPKVFPGTPTQLFRNLGPRPDGKAKFADVTAAAKLAQHAGPGLGVLCADFDGDGWPDLFVANDARPNHLWINQRDGTFKEEAVERGCAVNAAGRPEGNMGVVFGDVDEDGLPDLFVTHLTEETNTLWRQGPAGMFSDRTREASLVSGRRGTGFGVALADFDQDGLADLAIVNGRVARPPGTTPSGYDWGDYAERNHLFANLGRAKFRDVSDANADFCGSAGLGRGLCAGDLCGTGRVDLLATYVGAPARLYRNVVPEAGHWLLVRAVVPEWNRDAYGAVVTVHASGRRWTRLVQPGSSYLCSNDPRAHFGLGRVEHVESIHVAWPDGSVEAFPGTPADRRITVRRGEGKTAPSSPFASAPRP